MKLEVPIKVDIDDVTKLIHDLQCLQTYKLGVNDTTVLVSLDAVAGVFADHIRAKRLDKDIDSPTKWIPCSERLPEEDDYRPCYGHDDGVVWWANDMGIIGLGWYYNSTGQWAYYDEVIHSEQSVGKVLAWMPLPEPWEGE